MAVIIAQNNLTPPARPTTTLGIEVDIPTTSIDQADANAIRNAITVDGLVVSATLNPILFRTNTYGVNAPAVITRATEGELLNVRIENVTRGGFIAVSIPNSIGGGATPGAVKGSVIAGSKIVNSPAGVVIDGNNAAFSTVGAYFEGNDVGVIIRGGELKATRSIFINNTVGIQVSGATAKADINFVDFIGSGTDVILSDNPTQFQVINSNFDLTGTAIENTTPGLGDVLATGNWWGDTSGPNDDAGVINGSGARISLGVNAADFLPAEAAPIDTDRDGISDWEEINVYGTNPNLADTDGDGFPDGLEIAIGWDPLDKNSPVDLTDPSLNPTWTIDADGDGLVAAIDPDDSTFDTDGDGFADWYEVLRGTDPDNALDFPPFGDVDSDGLINNADATAILEAFLGLRNFTSIRRFEADINRDGVVNNVDAVILYGWTLRNIPYIPFP